ncbi:MAG TPA: 23S rRNA (uracil(1939)-C(5))-methyltransferase RlmD [Candidatus Udaeobacter sp.]|nr:23S rRNA (uracil(1939)-C(5))-methyltransferase RlmD [Candidatus Udaeobacter sp.]
MTHINLKNELTLEIDSLSYGPYGIGRVEGKAVMIPNTAPGDRVAAHIVESQERYAVGELVRLLRPSPARQPPPCPYVGECGGCPWQHVRYEAQLTAKQQNVASALRRIGKLDGFDLRPIVPSANEYHYRRRIRLQLDERQRLGFYQPSSHRLVEIDACRIAVQAVNECLAALRSWIRQTRSALEYLEIVTGDRPGEVVLVAKSTAGFVPNDQAAWSRLLEQEPRIRGLILTGRDWRRTWGNTRISLLTEDHICLTVEADVFTQINPEGNRRILTELLTTGDFTDQDRVLELYGGPGNFTLSIAKRAREVVAVEGHRPSVDSGKQSAQLNHLSNINWIVSDVPAAVGRLVKRRETFTKIVLDPPRAGAKGIDRHLASLGAEKILYVSCNPTTLARDLAALATRGYKLTLAQPVDLFPHTFHVEVLALMERV